MVGQKRKKRSKRKRIINNNINYYIYVFCPLVSSGKVKEKNNMCQYHSSNFLINFVCWYFKYMFCVLEKIFLL